MSHRPQQLQAWLARCRVNLAKFRQDRHNLSEAEQIEFVRAQYQILQTGMKVVKGRARFEGI